MPPDLPSGDFRFPDVAQSKGNNVWTPMSHPAPKSARIEVFRPGSFTSMEGAKLSYTADDLRAIAASYDYATAPAPVVVGHPKTDAPAFGWAGRFDYDGDADRLTADLNDLEPSFAEAVQAGRFKKVSLSFFHPHHPANPRPGTWYPKHIGFLGAAAPAVTGLANVAFSTDSDAITFEASFGDPGFERSANMFRRLREFFIDKYGIDDADRALPGYDIEWLGETSTPSVDISAIAPSYAAGGVVGSAIPPNPPILSQEVTVPEKSPDEKARESALNAREIAIAARERDIAHADNISFAEGLVTDGKLLPAFKDKVVAILDVLPAEKSVSFASGEDVSPAEAIKEVLAAQPKIVNFGATDMGDPPGTQDASFASDGRAVDAEGLALHHKAEAYLRAHPEASYLAAVKAVS